MYMHTYCYDVVKNVVPICNINTGLQKYLARTTTQAQQHVAVMWQCGGTRAKIK